MLLQCVLVALMYFASTSRALRGELNEVREEFTPVGGVAVAASNAFKSKVKRENKAWKANGQRYLRDVQAVPGLVPQPEEPLDAEKCFGRDAVVPIKDYHIKEGNP